MVLVAWLMGNVASLRLPEDEVNREIEEPSKSFRRILNESFGKISEDGQHLAHLFVKRGRIGARVYRNPDRIRQIFSIECLHLVKLGSRDGRSCGVGSCPKELTYHAPPIDEVHVHAVSWGTAVEHKRGVIGSMGEINVPLPLESSPQEHDSSAAAPDMELARILHLSLEEAFYLKYCEKCLELVLMDNTGASVVLSTETLSGARDGEVRHRRRVPQEIDFPAERIVDSGSLRLSEETGCERHPAKDAASHLSDEQAWQYFCQRLLAFPLTFAVYRHFRSRGYTVHSGQKYGAHFVLYEGSPDEVHSRYCVHVMNANGGDSWGHMKTMSRLMPDIAKSLLVCGVSYRVMDRDRSLSPEFPPLDTCSLQALDVAKVEVLSLSRLNDSEHTLNFDLDTPGYGRIGGPSSGLGARGVGAGKARGSESLKKKRRGTSKPGGVK